MNIIRDHAGLTDAWDASHPTTSSSSSVDMTSPRDMITHYGNTADSPINSYSAVKPLDSDARKFLGKRLDYIFYLQYSTPSIHSIDDDRPVLSCSDTKVVFTDLVPGHKFSFSDHFGVEATLDIRVADSDKEFASNSKTL